MTLITSKRRNRGRVYPELAAALKIYLGLEAENKSLGLTIPIRGAHSTIHAIYAEIDKNRDRYQAGDRFSIEALRNAFKEQYIMPTTALVIKNFLSLHAPELILPDLLPDVTLDVSAFFGMVHQKLRTAVVGISGTYQSYARATSIPDAEEMVRRGRVRIWYDRKIFQLRIEESQHRPKIKNYREIFLQWNGFCACRDDKLFCIMRTERSSAKSTPLFCIFNINFSSLKEGHRVETMKGVSMGFDPDIANWPSFPTIFLERCDEANVIIDFCEKSKIPTHIASEIFPRKKILQRKISPS